ncbi:MAG TPA: ribosome silencing factor [Clostridiales bacterium]|nr:ribosome silencing factor [Clostridiales bacterium]HBE12945.1 ribosome silencing factor [Clostridiales bacterium]HCG34718.1 ribosome silencing factor [Clostridiales bacterium]
MVDKKILDLATQIAGILEEKKAQDVRIFRVADRTVIADYFVIATGTSSTHVKALTDEVEFKLGEEGKYPTHSEGYDHAGWIVLDYDSILVHVFQKDSREFFKLEKLWADAEEIKSHMDAKKEGNGK